MKIYKSFIVYITLVFSLSLTSFVLAQTPFWQQTSGPLDPETQSRETDVSALAKNSSGTVFCTIFGGAVFKTSDNGETWVNIPHPAPISDAGTVSVNANDDIFIADFWNSSLVRSTDDGATWHEIITPVSGSSDGGFRNIAFGGNSIFLAYGNFMNTSLSGLYRSTDNGQNWEKVGDGLTNTDISGIAIAPNNDIYISTSYDGLVFRSTNNGDNFIQTTFQKREWVNSVAVHPDGAVLASGEGGFWVSTNNGDSWTTHNAGLVNSNPGARAITVGTNGDIYATPFDGGVAVSRDIGATWTRIDAGLTTSRTLGPIVISNDHVFAGSRDAGVFRSVSTITSIAQDQRAVPKDFQLYQNYPNPFNPTTTISFSLANHSKVLLTVYDISGREVAKLLDGNMQTGTHGVVLDAQNLASGVYFYKLKAGNLSQTRKLMLVK